MNIFKYKSKLRLQLPSSVNKKKKGEERCIIDRSSYNESVDTLMSSQDSQEYNYPTY